MNSSASRFVDIFLPKLQAFVSSSAQFEILHTLPKPRSFAPSKNERSILYILDSSFNPPTKAHYRIASSALASHQFKTAKRLLLLLAIQNADKAPKPETFEQRLAMMAVFAQDILDLASQGISKDDPLTVDIGVTKLPYFTDKSTAIANSIETGETLMEQVHLIGFDTVKRILDPKYYPPDHNLKSLAGLFQKHRFRCTYRTDESYGSKLEQDEYINDLASGRRDKEGADRKWAQKIELVGDRKEGEDAISSTKAREALAQKDSKRLHDLCTDRIADWILCNGLYNTHSKADTQI